MREIKITWDGPFKISDMEHFDDGGSAPRWDGKDYGLYQIYGRHILCGEDTLLYIGIATEQTFSERFRSHERWLLEDQDEKDVAIYLGRVFDPDKHSEEDKWMSWRTDVKLAEKILIYKYSPNYNGRDLAREPDLSPHKSVRLLHTGNAHKLQELDKAPGDW